MGDLQRHTPKMKFLVLGLILAVGTCHAATDNLGSLTSSVEQCVESHQAVKAFAAHWGRTQRPARNLPRLTRMQDVSGSPTCLQALDVIRTTRIRKSNMSVTLPRWFAMSLERTTARQTF